MRGVLAIAAVEFAILRRNRWLLIATFTMAAFALALTLAGAAPSGNLDVGLLTMSVASMTTLSVYLVPLIALMMSFEAVAGEGERGTLSLLLSYPVGRWQVLLGKLSAQVLALVLAILVGFGTGAVLALVLGGGDAAGLWALARLVVAASLLGVTFLGIGLAVSSLSTSVAGAAGLAGLAWLVLVVLYDMVLLGLLVMDDGGWFSQHAFVWFLVANPADALRLWGVSASDAQALVTGMGQAAAAVPGWSALASLLLWPLVTFTLALAAFSRRSA